MKQSPRNTVSSPPSKSDVPLCKRDLPKFKSLRVTRCGLFSIFYKSTFLTNLRFHIETHPKTYRDFTCVTCKKVRLICSEGPKRRFEGFVSSRNSLLINFDLYQDLVLLFRQFGKKTVDDVVESSEKN